MSDENEFEYITRKEAETMARKASAEAATHIAKGSSVTDGPDVVVVRGFLGREKADALLEHIRGKVEFRQDYIQLFGRKPIPRLQAWYGSWDYSYAKGMDSLKATPIPDFLQEVFDEIAAAGFGKFNAVLINLYWNGKNHVSWHSDDDYGDPEPTIPSLTLGATRPFRLKSKLDRSTMVEYLPGHGDLLVMRGRTNSEWQHSVPKTVKPIGERINLTFRMRQAQKAPTKQESKPPSKGGAEHPEAVDCR